MKSIVFLFLLHISHQSYKLKPKPAGPFGKGIPNYQCEDPSETLLVTETEETYEEKCHEIYKVQCSQGFQDGKVRY